MFSGHFVTKDSIEKLIRTAKNNLANPMYKNDITVRENAQQVLKIQNQKLEKLEKPISLEFQNSVGLHHGIQSKQFLYAKFGAQRSTKMLEPTGVEIVKLGANRVRNPINAAPQGENSVFIKYMVHLETQKAYAFASGDSEKVDKITNWFNTIENIFRDLLEEPDLALIFIQDKYNFCFELKGMRFKFDELSSGFSSIVDLVTEIIVKMSYENSLSTTYNLNGLVLIDEIETHLHISLQRKILNILTKIFPKIQFIVSTHSPFVLNNAENTIIVDLENRKRVEGLTSYKIETLIDSYFDSLSHSEKIERTLEEFNKIVELGINASNAEEFKSICQILDKISYETFPEVYVSYHMLKLKGELGYE